MVNIVITDSCRGGITVSAAGHAGYAPRGRDIVCAGVSAVLYGCLACLMERAEAQRHGYTEQPLPAPVVIVSDKPGLFVFSTSGFTDGFDLDVGRIMAGSLRKLAAAYPQYVSVQTVET